MDDELSFPDHLITEVKRSMFHDIECTDIGSEEDLHNLVRMMFEFSERDFFLYCPASSGVNQMVLAAEVHGVLSIVRTEKCYYPHPNSKHDYVKIDRKEPLWDWEKEVRETAPEFLRCTLKLTDRWRRKLALKEALSEQEANKDEESPLILKPTMFGFGIDLQKALKWLKSRKKNGPNK
ncbi:MAG: hypothetical protein SCH71_06185 [Desulfobulbaceae bacterium]|nr:hypothetical protein [Desulfobulbaceae bacterium]